MTLVSLKMLIKEKFLISYSFELSTSSIYLDLSSPRYSYRLDHIIVCAKYFNYYIIVISSHITGFI